MQLKELTTEKLNEKMLEILLGKNIYFNIYGISGDYLFLIKDDSMAVYDTKKNEYIIPYKKGLLKFFKQKSTNKKVIAYATSSNITEVKYGYKYHGDNKYDLVCDCERLLYSRFDLSEHEKPTDVYYVQEDSVFNAKVRLQYRNGGYIDECDLEHDPDFDFIYPDNLINNFKINSNYRMNYAPLKVCDKWDAQSKYDNGLSIIYKCNEGKELYGVVDSNYNVLFDYDENIIGIKVLSNDLILVEGKNGLNSIFDLKEGIYVVSFKYKFDEVVKLDKDIYKVEKDGKYRLVIDNEICDILYDSIAFDRGTIILTLANEIIFMDTNKNILYKLEKQQYFKSSSDVYYNSNSNIIRHNLYTDKEQIIGCNSLYDGDKEIKDMSIEQVLNNYKYYYFDNDGKIDLYKSEKYGIKLENNGISVNRWYDNYKYVREFQKRFLENLISIGEENFMQINQEQKVLKK